MVSVLGFLLIPSGLLLIGRLLFILLSHCSSVRIVALDLICNGIGGKTSSRLSTMSDQDCREASMRLTRVVKFIDSLTPLICARRHKNLRFSAPPRFPFPVSRLLLSPRPTRLPTRLPPQKSL